MLELQKYLSSGKTFSDLSEELGINVYHHPTLPLVGMKYNQLNSPKTNGVVRNCRGIVLHKDTFECIAKPYDRFYNFGENLEQQKDFEWTDFTIQEKADGSLLIVYHYDGEWHANTSGSFGLAECNFSGKSWRELFWETSGIDRDKLDSALTYIFELWTPYNKVVRVYPRPTAFLLSAMVTRECRELSVGEVDILGEKLGVVRPENFQFSSIDEIKVFLGCKEQSDPTYEGVIIRDRNNIRCKIKTDSYLFYHHMLDNGNLFNPKRLVPIALKGECEEILANLPELRPHFEKVKSTIEPHWEKLEGLWASHGKIEDRKEFALAIVKETPFSSVLFSMKNLPEGERTPSRMRQFWIDSYDLILKKLF